MIRPGAVARFASSTTMRRGVRRSSGASTRSRPPSARANCSKRSESRVSRFKVVSISAARAAAEGSAVSPRSRCAWAMAPASGVRSSWAAFAAKLRSASKAALSRVRTSLSVAASWSEVIDQNPAMSKRSHSDTHAKPTPRPRLSSSDHREPLAGDATAGTPGDDPATTEPDSHLNPK